MASVGEKLRRLREARETTIEEMATATGIGQSYLEALERDAIDELPGRAFGKLYIRAYAEVFSFDPRPLIADYDREQRGMASAATEAEPAPSAAAGSRPVAAAIAQWKAARVPESKPEPVIAIEEDSVEAIAADPDVVAPITKRRLAPIAIAGIAVVAIAIYFGLRPPDGGGTSEPTPVGPGPSVPEPLPPAPPPPLVPEPQEPPAKELTPAETPIAAIRVTESGVGRRIANLRLEGASARFEPGTRVCFATRVVGGRRGGVIHHRWIYQGRLEQTITLKLGGPDWRTHSNKTLGRAGAWAVEARDENGNVLARIELDCAP